MQRPTTCHLFGFTAAAAVALLGVTAWTVANRGPMDLRGSSASAYAHSRTLTATSLDSASARRDRTSHHHEVRRELGSILRLGSLLHK
ncbi:MAG: hypothetical protein JWM27_339 [Gemmatimonadetes bacterium]|nr:hypothetical protein [Gemmatimonadota bacterium]